MIDLRLFRIPAFSASLAINFLSIFVTVGYFLFVAQYLQLVLGLSPLEAGLWSLPSAIGFVVASNAAPRIVRRFPAAYVIGAGLALSALGLGVLTQVGGSNGLAAVIIGSIIISLGLAPVFSLTTDLIVGSAPPERAGAASGISETASELGGALGISVLGSIGVALYRGSSRRCPARRRPGRCGRGSPRHARRCGRRGRPAARRARRRRSSVALVTHSSRGCRSSRRSARSSRSGVAILAVVMLRKSARAPTARQPSESAADETRENGRAREHEHAPREGRPTAAAAAEAC